MELEKREDGWMERRGMGEYIEQWARPQRLKNGKNRCAFLQSNEETLGKGGRRANEGPKLD